MLAIASEKQLRDILLLFETISAVLKQSSKVFTPMVTATNTDEHTIWEEGHPDWLSFKAPVPRWSPLFVHTGSAYVPLNFALFSLT